MDRRKFLKSMVGGLAAASAVRTFPFRVFSFPKEVQIANPFLTVSELRVMEELVPLSLSAGWNDLMPMAMRLEICAAWRVPPELIDPRLIIGGGVVA